MSYKNKIIDLLNCFDEQYQLSLEYYNILCELIKKLDEEDVSKEKLLS